MPAPRAGVATSLDQGNSNIAFENVKIFLQKYEGSKILNFKEKNICKKFSLRRFNGLARCKARLDLGEQAVAVEF